VGGRGHDGVADFIQYDDSTISVDLGMAAEQADADLAILKKADPGVERAVGEVLFYIGYIGVSLINIDIFP